MEGHYKTLSAIFPIILRTTNNKRQVLLHRRANTGYMDGMWDFAGSVDEGETATQAVIRECLEEIGITVESSNISFAHLSHRLVRNGGLTYYDIYFTICAFGGKPCIAEPNKCSAMEWFDIDALPADMIKIRKAALEYWLNGVSYSEVVI